MEDKGLGPLELALGTGLTSLARKGAASNLWNAARNLFRGKSSSGAKGVQFVAKDGTKITGFTKHGVNRAIGDGGKRTGVKPGKILDALKNPQRIRESVSPDGQPARVFIGKGARVVVNPESGKIVSVNPLSRRRKR